MGKHRYKSQGPPAQQTIFAGIVWTRLIQLGDIFFAFSDGNVFSSVELTSYEYKSYNSYQ